MSYRYAPPKRREYNSTPQVVDGHRFDSKMEAEYYAILKLNRDIAHIDVHPYLTLGPGDRHCIDFLVWYKDGRVEAIDVKGPSKTRAASTFRRLQKRWNHPTVALRAVTKVRGRWGEWE